MEVIMTEYAHRGRYVRTAWSSQVNIVEVLLSVRVSHWVFHGVRAETTDTLLDWPTVESLLWVFEDGGDFKVYQDIQYFPPQVDDGDLDRQIEAILGHYQLAGDTYIAVKWQGHYCPTWELEEDIPYSSVSRVLLV